MTGIPPAGSGRGLAWPWQSDQPWSGGDLVDVAMGYMFLRSGYYSGCRNSNNLFGGYGYFFNSFEVDLLPAVVTEIFCLAIGVGGGGGGHHWG